MTHTRLFAAASLALPLFCASFAFAQDKAADSPSTPPHLLVLVRQEVQYGKSTAHQKISVNMAKACNRLNVPNDWIALEAITGQPESVSFDPFDSYEHIEQALTGWNQIYSAHPELSKMQDEISALLTSQRTIIAERRDDLGYRADTIDLSDARYMRVIEIHFSPGHENDFAQSFNILHAAYEKTKSESPWVVYQIKMGSVSPGFLIFVPMTNLKQNDAILSWTEGLTEFEGEEDAQQLQQIARDTSATSESNLYAIVPEMSHVAKKFAAGVSERPRHLSDAQPATPSSPTPSASAEPDTPKSQPAADPGTTLHN